MKIARFCCLLLLLFLFPALPLLFAAELPGRYALILADPPVADRVASAAEMRGAVGLNYRKRIETAQTALRRELESRKYQVTGSVQLLMNAVFVRATKSQLPELRSLPGVRSVIPLHAVHPHLDKAVQLENVPAAWTALGGAGNAGAGVKIAVLDSGIDQNHPGFQDASLAVPPGFPKCAGDDCKFTNNKVIVARSYVSELAAGPPSDPASTSTPDDLSPRDRVGHGTAVAMVAAGVTNSGPAATITGVAPKAWLGNYKIYGSPGINDGSTEDVIVQALEDAVVDGMDVAVLSSGHPALNGPLDQGAICGASGSDPCDISSVAVEKATQADLVVVVSAGNSGDSGTNIVPTFNTVESPAIAPSAIAVGASSNSHAFYAALRAGGQTIQAIFGDGPEPAAPLTAPLSDVSKLDSTGYACAALPAGSLSGTLALVLRSPAVCTFNAKVINVQNAGAVGVVIMDVAGTSAIFPGPPGGLTNTSIPAILIQNSDGLALRSSIAANPGLQGTLDPSLHAFDVSTFNQAVFWSSHGPSISYLLKPELAAVGTNVYMAAQSYDPNGVMYDPTGYTAQSGTSFAAPMVAGAVALAKQKNPNFTPAQLKSAVVNTATQDLTDSGSPAGVYAVGNGKLNGGGAVQTTLTASPSTISFGALGSTTKLPLSSQFTLHYSGTASANVTLSVVPKAGSRNTPALDKTSLSFTQAQPDQTVTLTISGSLAAGVYEGGVAISGGGSTLRVPYLYVAGDGIPADTVMLDGDGFDYIAGEQIPGAFFFKVIDQYGVAVPNVPVAWGVSRGGGLISGDTKTDANGVAGADAIIGARSATQEFFAQTAGGLSITFSGTARVQPTISNNGVVSAAGFQVGPGIAPGSYISIFGTGLSDYVGPAEALPLPLFLGDVSVSFDVPSAGLSLPGRIIYVSDGQVNVQAPWELKGQTSVMIKATVNGNFGNVVTVPVSDYAPAIFASGGIAAALDQNFAVIGAANPAQRGNIVQLFVNGLGPVDNTPNTGEAAQSQPLSRTLSVPTVTIGGVNAPVQFSGLAPGFPGLYQLNVMVSPDTPAGTQPVVISIGGQTSEPVNLPVQ